MKKTVIIYASRHHGNTRKLVEAVFRRLPVTLVDAASEGEMDLTGFDLIGFASGIDFGKFYAPVEAFLQRNLPEQKEVFFLYTCARTGGDFTRTIREKALARDSVLLGEYGCRGYNTYGPLKLVGGMNKNHPTEAEEADAAQFVERLMKKH